MINIINLNYHQWAILDMLFSTGSAETLFFVHLDSNENKVTDEINEVCLRSFNYV